MDISLKLHEGSHVHKKNIKQRFCFAPIDIFISSLHHAPQIQNFRHNIRLVYFALVLAEWVYHRLRYKV